MNNNQRKKSEVNGQINIWGESVSGSGVRIIRRYPKQERKEIKGQLIFPQFLKEKTEDEDRARSNPDEKNSAGGKKKDKPEKEDDQSR